MILSLPNSRESTLRALLVTTVLAGFIGYCFLVFSAVRLGAINLPFGAKKSGLSQAAAAQTAPRRYDSAKAWTYDFTTMPNGPLPAEDWNFEAGNEVAAYNREAETYTGRPENVRIEDGALVIEARHEDLNDRKFTSGRVNTKNKIDFTYGTLEIVAKLPQGVGTWPAAWLLPVGTKYNPDNYGIQKNDRLRWAVNGEIDVLEALGSHEGQNHPHLHSYNELIAPPKLMRIPVNDPYSYYHRYGIIKTPDKITFTLDGVSYDSRQKTSDSPLDWPYDQPYYLIINLAIGGEWATYINPDGNWAPRQLKIQSIAYRPL